MMITGAWRLALLLAAPAVAKQLGAADPSGGGISGSAKISGGRATLAAAATAAMADGSRHAVTSGADMVARAGRGENGDDEGRVDDISAEGPSNSPPEHAEELRSRAEALFASLSRGLDEQVASAAPQLAARVAEGLYDGAGEREFEELAAETAAYQASMHPDFAKLAARVAVTRLHRHSSDSFIETLRRLREHTDPVRGEAAPLVKQELYDLALTMADRLDAALVHSRDFEMDYFGLKTLQRAYLLGKDAEHNLAIERPQHMLMRVALAVHGDNVDAVLTSYDLMSRGIFTHATPTLFNAGCPRGQLCSCFLLTVKDDSVEGIFETLRDCSLISRAAGGIGLSVSHVRAAGSFIRSTGGKACGLTPMLRVFDATARYVDQGGGKRKGAFAMYLEPWHADVEEFLDLKKNTGKEEARARDLFYALWLPDLFMRRVAEGGDWSLFCPDTAPGLVDVCGADFDELYERYEREGRARRVVPAQQLWFKILEAQVETGTPYLLYKDAANAKSNQRHLGTIRGSNLCTEIMQFTSADEIAVCNLASVALPRFVRARPDGPAVGPAEGAIDELFDLEELRRVTYFVARSLDQVISRTLYPLPEAERSNARHRPMGIGVQGLADVFAMLRLPFESDGARALNVAVFEAMYYGALQASADLAEEHGPHESFAGSPASEGELQFDMWGIAPSDRWDWPALKERIQRVGLRNSLLLAPMPTASTAQILGNNECFEPYTSNLYARRTLAGEFFVLNRHLQRELQNLGLWSREMRDAIIAAGGSVQGIEAIPTHLRAVFKTAWEMSQRSLIDMAADRGAFIDQSQSLNVFVPQPSFAQLSSMHFYGWKKGLKTGMYYLRSQPAADAIKFTVASKAKAEPESAAAEPAEAAACPLRRPGDEGVCEACSG